MREKEEKIREIIDRLSAESAKGTLIVVEGRKDVETLRNLGINGYILSIKTGGKTVQDILDQIRNLKSKEVILMLDFDSHGKETTIKLKQELERQKIEPNTHFWNSLKAMLGKDVQCIEGIDAFLTTLNSKIQ